MGCGASNVAQQPLDSAVVPPPAAEQPAGQSSPPPPIKQQQQQQEGATQDNANGSQATTTSTPGPASSSDVGSSKGGVPPKVKPPPPAAPKAPPPPKSATAPSAAAVAPANATSPSSAAAVFGMPGVPSSVADGPPAARGNKSANSTRMGPAIPVSVLTDSYKASHFLMYPEAELMVAYGEFRGNFQKDPTDSRFVFYGIRYIIENFVSVRWTEADVEAADQFYKTHNAGYTPFPFPKDLFLQFVRENDGYFPVRIEALPEGSVANIHVPVYQIFAYKQYSRLITFLETILTQVWYPTTVATLSRRTKEVIANAFDKSVDPAMQFLLDSRLHDFGMRGCTSIEQSVIGGVAHLLNFAGSDTMSACWYAQYRLNNGKPIATSIPATEHSVMTSWPTERLAMENMIDKFGGPNAVFACVMDSYDYDNALNKVMPSIAAAHKAKGGLMVLRPDSGDPVECIVKALEAGEKTFGSTKNELGYKVLHGVSAIQGDGINYNTVKAILEATLKLGYSAQNVAFGMGGGLLQKVDRDTMQFATKLNFIIYKDGKQRNVMKRPKTDGGKFSLPGMLQVRRVDGVLNVYPREYDEKVDPKQNALQVVYDHGPVDHAWESFDAIKERVEREWKLTPRLHDPVSAEMKAKVKNWCANFDVEYDEMMKKLDEQQ